MATDNLASVIAETERDLIGVRSRLRIAMRDLAGQLEYYAASLVGTVFENEGHAVSEQGIIRDKAVEIDTLSARYVTLKEQWQRLQWLKERERQGDGATEGGQ